MKLQDPALKERVGFDFKSGSFGTFPLLVRVGSGKPLRLLERTAERTAVLSGPPAGRFCIPWPRCPACLARSAEFNWSDVSTSENNNGQIRAALPINELKLPLGWNISKENAAAVAALSVPMEHCSLITQKLALDSSPANSSASADEILKKLKTIGLTGRSSSDDFGPFEDMSKVIEQNGCAAVNLASLFDPSAQPTEDPP